MHDRPWDASLEVLERAAELRRAGVPFALATVTWSQQPTSARIGAKAVVTADGAIFGWVGGACSQPSVTRHAREALRDGTPRTIRLSPEGSGGRDGVVELAMTCHSGGTVEVFIEPYLPAPALVVVGDTPVTRALLAMAAPLGFHTVAMASPGDAAECYSELAFERLPSDRQRFVVVASMGALDEEALLAALRSEPAYLALVGSRRRFAAIAEFLRASGVDEARIASIHAPAGIDIHAETPAEIALSILAQIVDVRRTLAAGSERRDEALAPAQVAIDPICGMQVELAGARWTLERDGQLLAFCCPACRREYECREAAGPSAA